MKIFQKKFITPVIILLALTAAFFAIKEFGAHNRNQSKNDNLSPTSTETESKNAVAAQAQAKSDQTFSSVNNNHRQTSAIRPIVNPLNHEVNAGSPQTKKIALTLDAGASAAQTPAILDILKARNIHCTFFVTGKWAEQNPGLIRRMVAEGHTLGNHTYDHTDLTTLSDFEILEELSRTEAIIRSIVPSVTTKPYFRAPFGARNQHILDVAASAGYQEIYWTFDALDWKQESTASQVENRIYANVKNGAIILMHVGDNITPQILNRLLTNLKAQGYLLGTLEDLLRS